MIQAAIQPDLSPAPPEITTEKSFNQLIKPFPIPEPSVPDVSKMPGLAMIPPVSLPIDLVPVFAQAQSLIAPIVSGVQTDIPLLQAQISSGVDQVADAYNQRLSQAKYLNLSDVLQQDTQPIQQQFETMGAATLAMAGEVAGSLVKLDFGGVKQSVAAYGDQFKASAGLVSGNIGGLILGTIAYGIASLTAFSPVVLILGGIALAVFLVSTNFLGLRTILAGVITIVSGVTQGFLGLVQGVIQVAKGIITIFQGMGAALHGDFSLIQQGALMVFEGIQGFASSAAQIIESVFRGAVQILGGIFEGFEQIARSVFGGIEGIIHLTIGVFHSLGGAVQGVGAFMVSVLASPESAWRGFMSLLETIHTKFTGLVSSVSSAPGIAVASWVKT